MSTMQMCLDLCPRTIYTLQGVMHWVHEIQSYTLPLHLMHECRCDNTIYTTSLNVAPILHSAFPHSIAILFTVIPLQLIFDLWFLNTHACMYACRFPLLPQCLEVAPQCYVAQCPVECGEGNHNAHIHPLVMIIQAASSKVLQVTKHMWRPLLFKQHQTRYVSNAMACLHSLTYTQVQLLVYTYLSPRLQTSVCFPRILIKACWA